MQRLHHITETPYRNNAPGRLAGGEKVPIVHGVPDCRVGDVVRGEGETLDLHKQTIFRHLSDRRQRCFQEPGFGQIVALYDELSGHRHLRTPAFFAAFFRNAVFVVFADDFATREMFETGLVFETDLGFALAGCGLIFGFSVPAITPSRFFIA